jgi:hypothetical protein
MALKKSQLYASLWQSCDELRGGMDASQYKDYVLTLLFMKYVSDKYAGQPNALIEVPAGGGFADLVKLRGDKAIGEKINMSIAQFAKANDLQGVIDQADFNDESKLGAGKEMQDRLSKLLAIFAGLDFRANRAEGDDLLGDAYEYLMRHFATESGKSKGQFYTPAEVSRIIAQVVGIGPDTAQDQTLYDSDVDGLLGTLEALIAKKRAIKQATMQQLLTGRTRLPGFSGAWETMRLGDVANLRRDNILPAAYPEKLFVHFSLPAFDSGRIPVIEPGKSIGSNKFLVPPSAVLVSKLNPRIPRVWAPAEISENSIASTEFLVLIPEQIISRNFLYLVCSSTQFCEQMELAATGTTGSHQRMNPMDTLNIKILVPPDNTEQTAIAAILSDMDAEIAALARRREKTRVIKQGMMQELLTGRTRLV